MSTLILTLLAVMLLAFKPDSSRVALGVAGLAALGIALGAPIAPAIGVIPPLLVFLTAALTLARTIEASGLCGYAADVLAAYARGNALALYALVCVVSALLTATLSLDGAVLLMVPVVRVLARDFRAPFTPLFVAVVVVANSFSVAVPVGNPTNLVVMRGAGLSAGTFLGHMFVPGFVAACICAGLVAVREGSALSRARLTTTPARRRLSTTELRALLGLVLSALSAWLAPLFGISPWWAFSVAAAAAVVIRCERPRLRIPWRLAAELGGLLVLVRSLPVDLPGVTARTLPALVVVAVGVAGVSALANNLPASAGVQSLLTATPAAYAAAIGLAVGALATTQGSVATLLARGVAGPAAPDLPVRKLAPVAGAGVLVATFLLWIML